jgi:hypothetical protein
MPTELHILNDFATILDGGEPLTLKRRASATTIALPKAWRYSSIAQAAEPGVADVVRADAVWQFPWATATELPRVGDQLIDAAHDGWTILSVEIRGHRSRLRCHTRNLRIAHELNNRVELQAAVWEENEIVGWTTLRTAIPARIQPDRTITNLDANPHKSTATYRIHLADDTPLNHNHRLVDPDGNAYRVQEYTQAARIDALPVAIATETTA